MSAHGVTWRSSRARVTGHLPGTRFTARPFIGPRNALTVTSKPFKLFRGAGSSPSTVRGAMQGIPGPYGPTAAKAVEKAALRRLAFKLVKPRPLEFADFLVRPLATRFWRTHVDPTGFPGWGNFNTGWTSNPGAPWPGIEPGDYTINGFDVSSPWGTVVPNLVDRDDGDILGLRYWGHYESDPLPGGAPGIDWEVRSHAMELPASASQPAYRRLVDHAPSLQAQPWGPRKNISIGVSTTFRDPIRIRRDVARIRDRGDKAKPANQFVWLVLRFFADSMGEAWEWIDIFAAASGYIKGSMMLPDHLRDTGKETQAKFYWLFNVGGINNLDWTALAVLVVENEIEDHIYGAIGRLSKAAARSLGLTVGPQTGLVM